QSPNSQLLIQTSRAAASAGSLAMVVSNRSSTQPRDFGVESPPVLGHDTANIQMLGRTGAARPGAVIERRRVPELSECPEVTGSHGETEQRRQHGGDACDQRPAKPAAIDEHE